MSLVSRILARVAKLPPAETYDIAVEKNLPMPDGVVLPADHYYPRHGKNLPTLLVRTPYGRSGAGLVGQLFAERGFQALIQSCRGQMAPVARSILFAGSVKTGWRHWNGSRCKTGSMAGWRWRARAVSALPNGP